MTKNDRTALVLGILIPALAALLVIAAVVVALSRQGP